MTVFSLPLHQSAPTRTRAEFEAKKMATDTVRYSVAAATSPLSLNVSMSQCQNLREYNEDRGIVALFETKDEKAVESKATPLKTDWNNLFWNKIYEQLQKNAIRITDTAREGSPGSTGVNAVITAKGVYVASLGDSLAYLVEVDEKGEITSRLINTYLHKPNKPEEQARIEQAGGWVGTIPGSYDPTPRLNGTLAMSGAIGDCALQSSGLATTPKFSHIETHAKESYLLLASDGIEQLTPQEIATAFKQVRDKATHKVDIAQASDLVTRTAKQRGSSDNITVMITDLSVQEHMQPGQFVVKGVYDGHGGAAIAQNCIEQLPDLAQHYATEMMSVVASRTPEETIKLERQETLADLTPLLIELEQRINAATKNIFGLERNFFENTQRELSNFQSRLGSKAGKFDLADTASPISSQFIQLQNGAAAIASQLAVISIITQLKKSHSETLYPLERKASSRPDEQFPTLAALHAAEAEHTDKCSEVRRECGLLTSKLNSYAAELAHLVSENPDLITSLAYKDCFTELTQQLSRLDKISLSNESPAYRPVLTPSWWKQLGSWFMQQLIQHPTRSFFVVVFAAACAVFPPLLGSFGIAAIAITTPLGGLLLQIAVGVGAWIVAALFSDYNASHQARSPLYWLGVFLDRSFKTHPIIAIPALLVVAAVATLLTIYALPLVITASVVWLPFAQLMSVLVSAVVCTASFSFLAFWVDRSDDNRNKAIDKSIEERLLSSRAEDDSSNVRHISWTKKAPVPVSSGASYAGAFPPPPSLQKGSPLTTRVPMPLLPMSRSSLSLVIKLRRHCEMTAILRQW
ncbi:hypothetical protein BH10PSE19_BH10PSE19_01400 [soil metagenome]